MQRRKLLGSGAAALSAAAGAGLLSACKIRRDDTGGSNSSDTGGFFLWLWFLGIFMIFTVRKHFFYFRLKLQVISMTVVNLHFVSIM